jgi:hypothetical protein
MIYRTVKKWPARTIEILKMAFEVGHTCNPRTKEAGVGELQIWGQPGLYNKTLSQKNVSFIHENHWNHSQRIAAGLISITGGEGGCVIHSLLKLLSLDSTPILIHLSGLWRLMQPFGKIMWPYISTAIKMFIPLTQ